MKRINNLTLGILGATVLSLGLYACSNDDAETVNTTTEQTTLSAKRSELNVEEQQAMKDFNKSLLEVFNDPYIYSVSSKYVEVEIVDNETLLELKSKLSISSKNLLKVKFKEDEQILSDLETLTEEEVISLASYFYTANQYQTYGGVYTDNLYIDCALDALSLGGAIQGGAYILESGFQKGVERYIKENGAKAALQMVGKTIGRSLSYVGWAMAAYDFITCINK